MDYTILKSHLATFSYGDMTYCTSSSADQTGISAVEIADAACRLVGKTGAPWMSPELSSLLTVKASWALFGSSTEEATGRV